MDLKSAAKRHLRCAERLAAQQEASEACYLIGLAAECAVKAHLVEIGYTGPGKSKNKQDVKSALWIHFPDLATELLAHGEGSIARSVLTIIGDQSLLKGWSVKMRYKHEVSSPTVVKRYAKWKDQTNQLFVEVGLV